MLRSRKESRRILILALSLFLCFSLLVIQFYRLQVKENAKWVSQANLQHQTVVVDNFKRGVFYSNTHLKYGHREKKQAFALDVLKYHLCADPSSIGSEFRPEIVAKLAEVLQLDDDEQATIEKGLSTKSRYRKLYRWLSIDQKKGLKQWWRGFSKKTGIASNALFFVKDYQRMHPFGKLLGQVVHTVRDERDEISSQAIPTGGLEMHFDEILKGQKGKRLVLRSPRQALETLEVIEPVQHGSDVYLTINHFLQAICEEELAKGVEKVKGKGGQALMMDPQTGEILAMAQYPFFNPSEYKRYYNDPEQIEHTSIKTISDCFEPGSTMKAISAAIALKANETLEERGEEPLFYPDAPMRCDLHKFPGRGPLYDGRTHKYLNMDMALQKSSNVYVARLMLGVVDRLGADWYRDQLEDVFGFGVKSGVELPYENGGFVPKPGALYSAGQLQWSLPTPVSLSMGYNLLANSVQMARAFSVFANGGYLVSPTLVKRVATQEGDAVDFPLNHADRQRVLSPAICSQIIKSMRFVTKKGGIGMQGDVYGYTIAAKTSTSEKLIDGAYDKSRHFSTFIGIAPATDPKFVLLIAVDDPEKRFIPGFGTTHFGGKCAAPIFREIAKRSLAYLGVRPDDPFGYPAGDPRSDLERAAWVEEARELAELHRKWNEG